MFLEHLLVGLVDESIPVAFVCPPDCDVDSVVSPAVEVIRHPVFDLPLMGPQNRKKLTEQLAGFEPTVLHCLCRSKAKLTRQLSRQLNLPYVLTVNSLQKRTSRISISARRCAKIIAPAESIVANIAKLYPGLAERIERINIGTFVSETGGCFDQTSQLAGMVIAHPLDSAAEFENLLGAAKRLAIEGYEFMLVLIGGGPAEKQLRKLLDELGLLQIVTIVPRVQSWRYVLAAADIFILPVASAAFNPLLLEAMSAGMAVAACKGGVDDLIIQGQTAVVFNPDDELSIYDSLRQLFDRREFARQLAKGAQEYVRENHAVSKMVDALLQNYRQAQQWYSR